MGFSKACPSFSMQVWRLLARFLRCSHSISTSLLEVEVPGTSPPFRHEGTVSTWVSNSPAPPSAGRAFLPIACRLQPDEPGVRVCVELHQ